jgi:copper(I)-binding protein
VNRSTTRAWLAICGLVAAAALTGCGAGQISQMATMEPAVNGSAVTVNNIALRDIRVVAEQTTDALQPGKTVELRFVAVNQSPDANDSLVGITSEIGAVTVSGDTAIPASGTLIVGGPEGQDATALGAVEGAGRAKASVALTKPISNGLTYNFTFRFAKAGEVSVAVPVTAPDNAPRAAQKPAPGAGEGAHH